MGATSPHGWSTPCPGPAVCGKRKGPGGARAFLGRPAGDGVCAYLGSAAGPPGRCRSGLHNDDNDNNNNNNNNTNNRAHGNGSNHNDNDIAPTSNHGSSLHPTAARNNNYYYGGRGPPLLRAARRAHGLRGSFLRRAPAAFPRGRLTASARRTRPRHPRLAPGTCPVRLAASPCPALATPRAGEECAWRAWKGIAWTDRVPAAAATGRPFPHCSGLRAGEPAMCAARAKPRAVGG
eukprot:scaffold1457_cov350-Prasinococcus_capsulatus_cf.AAC.4